MLPPVHIPTSTLFDYLDNRSKLAPQARQQLDITGLTDEIRKHPDQPENLYLLAEAYLKTGKVDEARNTIAELDKLSVGRFPDDDRSWCIARSLPYVRRRDPALPGCSASESWLGRSKVRPCGCLLPEAPLFPGAQRCRPGFRRRTQRRCLPGFARRYLCASR